jgi:hypothetical protein
MRRAAFSVGIKALGEGHTGGTVEPKADDNDKMQPALRVVPGRAPAVPAFLPSSPILASSPFLQLRTLEGQSNLLDPYGRLESSS